MGEIHHAAKTQKPAAKSCYAMKETALAIPADKDVASGMSFHSNTPMAN